jgi:hypothetical protein
MEEQTYKDKPNGIMFHKSHCQDIPHDGIFCMQGMKTYPAPVGVEEGIGKNMVHIHQHRREEYQPVALPVLFIIPVRDRAYEDEVEEVVGEDLHVLVMSYGVMSYEFFVVILGRVSFVF